ncbi:uncharacterized protein M8220_003723 isoform 1-T5 [Acridotheres tristis]
MRFSPSPRARMPHPGAVSVGRLSKAPPTESCCCTSSLDSEVLSIAETQLDGRWNSSQAVPRILLRSVKHAALPQGKCLRSLNASHRPGDVENAWLEIDRRAELPSKLLCGRRDMDYYQAKEERVRAPTGLLEVVSTISPWKGKRLPNQDILFVVAFLL